MYLLAVLLGAFVERVKRESMLADLKSLLFLCSKGGVRVINILEYFTQEKTLAKSKHYEDGIHAYLQIEKRNLVKK